MPQKIKQLKEEYQKTSKPEIWVAVRDNFLYGLIMTTSVSFITTGIDIAVLISYMTYFFFVGKVINRPKYVTSLGKFIMFPVPAALGAYCGFKLGYIISSFF